MSINIETTIQTLNASGEFHPTTINGLPGMTSLEIAEATGKNHKHVLRGIRKMLSDVGPLLDRPQYAETSYRDAQGKSQPLIVLDKELTFTVLTGYNASLRLLVNRRWLELEGAGFARVSVQAAVVELVEREKDIRADVFAQMKRRHPRILTEAEKEAERYKRQADRQRNKTIKEGGWKFVADGG